MLSLAWQGVDGGNVTAPCFGRRAWSWCIISPSPWPLLEWLSQRETSITSWLAARRVQSTRPVVMEGEFLFAYPWRVLHIRKSVITCWIVTPFIMRKAFLKKCKSQSPVFTVYSIRLLWSLAICKPLMVHIAWRKKSPNFLAYQRRFLAALTACPFPASAFRL